MKGCEEQSQPKNRFGRPLNSLHSFGRPLECHVLMMAQVLWFSVWEEGGVDAPGTLPEGRGERFGLHSTLGFEGTS